MNRPRVLVTRSSHQGSELAERLGALGLEPVLVPTIELAEPSRFEALDEALRRLSHSSGPGDLKAPAGFDWILFTSANAVEAFGRRLNAGHSNAGDPDADQESAGDSQRLKRLRARLETHDLRGPAEGGSQAAQPLRIAAIGQATARALDAIGLSTSLVPPLAVAESLAAALLPYARRPDGSPAHFLLVRAEAAREHLPNVLRAAGAAVTVAPAYRTVVPLASVAQLRGLLEDPDRWPQAITFTSSSTARNLQALLEVSGLTLPAGILRVSIGPITSDTLRELDLPPHAEAAEATVPALAAAVAHILQMPGNRVQQIP